MIFWSCPDRDDVIDFHINYEQVTKKDAKSHDVQSETNTFSVTDETNGRSQD